MQQGNDVAMMAVKKIALASNFRDCGDEANSSRARFDLWLKLMTLRSCNLYRGQMVKACFDTSQKNSARVQEERTPFAQQKRLSRMRVHSDVASAEGRGRTAACFLDIKSFARSPLGLLPHTFHHF